MIEILSGLPANVVAVRASGRITRKDYDDVLIPAVQAVFEGRSRIRFYYELGPHFEGMDPGAVAEDFKVGMEHLTGWERVAVVTDVAWIRTAVIAFSFLLPVTVKVFAAGEAETAKAWMTAP